MRVGSTVGPVTGTFLISSLGSVNPHTALNSGNSGVQISLDVIRISVNVADSESRCHKTAVTNAVPVVGGATEIVSGINVFTGSIAGKRGGYGKTHPEHSVLKNGKSCCALFIGVIHELIVISIFNVDIIVSLYPIIVEPVVAHCQELIVMSRLLGVIA